MAIQNAAQVFAGVTCQMGGRQVPITDFVRPDGEVGGAWRVGIPLTGFEPVTLTFPAARDSYVHVDDAGPDRGSAEETRVTGVRHVQLQQGVGNVGPNVVRVIGRDGAGRLVRNEHPARIAVKSGIATLLGSEHRALFNAALESDREVGRWEMNVLRRSPAVHPIFTYEGAYSYREGRRGGGAPLVRDWYIEVVREPDRLGELILHWLDKLVLPKLAVYKLSHISVGMDEGLGALAGQFTYVTEGWSCDFALRWPRFYAFLRNARLPDRIVDHLPATMRKDLGDYGSIIYEGAAAAAGMSG